jgi:hypothetical protein
LYTFQTPRRDPPVYKALLIDSRLTQGTLFWPKPRAGRHALDFPLDELLFQNRFVREGRLEIHACAIVVRGRVWLFCGQSGAGKTTTARLWKRAEPTAMILSDDRVVLRVSPRGILACGTPWHGTGGFHSPLERPLAAIAFLEQSKTTQLAALPPSAGGALLFARSFPPMWDHAGVDSALQVCDRVVAAVPAYQFRFRNDRSAVDAVLEERKKSAASG